MSTQESIHMSDTQTFKSGINQLVAKALNDGGIASLRNCQTTTPDGRLINFEIIVHAELKALPVSNTGEPIKKESGLVKFNCKLNYASKDCDYNSSFQSGKNTPDQVLIDVIEHLGWMAGVDGEAKRAIAALNKGIARGVARKIELQSVDKPKAIEIDPTEKLEGMVTGSNATGIGRDHIDVEITKVWEKILEAARENE